QLEAADDRILPGGYFYLTDLLSDPDQLRKIGKIIASYYAESKATAIMTIATKGVPIAQMVALYLNIPFVIVRRDSKVTEGSTVSINYATKGTTRVEKMELTKSSLPQGSHVLVIDDFLNGGGTITGMNSMLKEFNSTCAGIAVLCESDTPDREIDFKYESLIKVQKDPSFAKGFELTLGTMFKDL
ncbi:phosphoribosyltransferase family protein, partial [Aerococcus urinaeequi]